MRRKWIFLVFLLLNCLLLGGCGGQSEKNSRAESGNGSGTESGNSFTVESGNGSGNISAVSAGEGMLSIENIRTFHFEEPEEGYNMRSMFYHVMSDKIYLFRVEYRMDGTGSFLGSDRVCVQIYDSKTQKVEQKVLTPDVPGYEEYQIVSAGLTADEEISLKLRERKEGDTPYILVKTDLQGTVLDIAKPFPDEALYPWNTDLGSETKVFHLADGRTILSRWDETAQASILTWFGGGNSGQALGRLDGEYAFAFCSGEEGILYCVAGDSLLRWNVKDNTMEELFRLSENGVNNGRGTGLFLTDDGEFLLCRITDEDSYVYVLTDREPENNAEIRLSCVLHPIGIDDIQRRASTFASETGNIPVVLEKVEETYQEDYRNRIFAELTAGKGPEIMWLSREDMELLAEKVALCDLSDMIPEDIKEKMIPAALELGMVDGKLVGFTPQVEFETLITADKTWAEDSWSISDLMKFAESKEHLEALASDWLSIMGPSSLLYWVLLRDINDSPFLDLEQGVSHFDSQEFIQLLELCKKYGRYDTSMDKDERIMMLREGKIAASWTSFDSPISFAKVMTDHGGDCHVVGFPTNSGSGNYMISYSGGYLAVNANAEHKKEIAEFIAYLLDYDYQFKVSGCSVRLDVIQNFDNKYSYSYTKPDGTTWLKEFLDFLENCEPEPVMPEQIGDIIYEEVKAYFNGDKSAAEAANIIHNRVQLYLDENS